MLLPRPADNHRQGLERMPVSGINKRKARLNPDAMITTRSFQTATASIRSTSKPYQFELIAQRSVSGEEAQLLGEEAESEQSVSGKRFNTDVSPSLGVDEYYQLIDARMQFTIQPASAADSDSPDAIAYTYVDSVSEEDSYMLVVEDATKEEREEFEMTIYRCMWEVDNMADAKNVSRAELLQYRYDRALRLHCKRMLISTCQAVSSSRRRQSLLRFQSLLLLPSLALPIPKHRRPSRRPHSSVHRHRHRPPMTKLQTS